MAELMVRISVISCNGNTCRNHGFTCAHATRHQESSAIRLGGAIGKTGAAGQNFVGMGCIFNVEVELRDGILKVP